MKLRRILETELPVFNSSIKAWKDWLAIRDSGRWNPTKVGADFDCSHNRLTSLVGAPDYVGGHFKCYYNNLTSLVGAPTQIGGNFNCSNAGLTSLRGAPTKVRGDFYCHDNLLTSLEGMADYVGVSFLCGDNGLTSLKNVHKHIKTLTRRFDARFNPITSNILGLLLINGLDDVKGDGPEFDIVNKHLKGDKDVLECQEEMISAGYKEFAKL